VNKSQLVERIATATGVRPADVAKVIDAFIEAVTGSVVRGEKVVLSGFGTFLKKPRARRTGRDITSGRPVRIPATSVPSFQPGKPFREQVAKRRGGRSSRKK
jgi:DNA-binding protein HU-beta